MSFSSDYNNLLGKIHNFQSVQKRLQTELNSLPSNSNFERQQLLITQIDNINARKIALFKNLYSLNRVLQNQHNASVSDLQARTEMLQMVEQQIKSTQQRLRKQKNQNINNLRMTQINNYYNGYYAIYFKVFRYIIYTSIFIIIIVFLRQRYILSAGVTNGLAILIIIIGGFFIGSTLFDFSNRNNMVISEYDFPTHKDSYPEHQDNNGLKPSSDWVDDINRWKNDMQYLEEGDCVGPDCCVGDGLIFDQKKMICKLDPGKATKKEGFTSGANLSPANIDDANVALITPNNNNYYTMN